MRFRIRSAASRSYVGPSVRSSASEGPRKGALAADIEADRAQISRMVSWCPCAAASAATAAGGHPTSGPGVSPSAMRSRMAERMLS